MQYLYPEGSPRGPTRDSRIPPLYCAFVPAADSPIGPGARRLPSRRGRSTLRRWRGPAAVVSRRQADASVGSSVDRKRSGRRNRIASRDWRSDNQGAAASNRLQTRPCLRRDGSMCHRPCAVPAPGRSTIVPSGTSRGFPGFIVGDRGERSSGTMQVAVMDSLPDSGPRTGFDSQNR